MPKTGRPSLFGPKDDTTPFRAIAMTKKGRRLVEQFRRHLKQQAKWPGVVSDGDVLEELARLFYGAGDYVKK